MGRRSLRPGNQIKIGVADQGRRFGAGQFNAGRITAAAQHWRQAGLPFDRIDALDADGQPYQSRADAGGQLLFGAQLGVGG